MQPSSSLSESLKHRTSSWIVNPAYDLMFFSTVWLPPLLVLASVRLSEAMSAVAFTIWIYHLFVRLPHFAATVHVTYRRKEQRDYYREHWIQFYVVPAVILLIYGALLFRPPVYPEWLRDLLVAVASLWGYQHIAMQNFGILQLYNSRAHLRPTLNAVRIEKAIYYCIVVGIYVDAWTGRALTWIDPGFSGSVSGMGQVVVDNILLWLIGIELFRRFATRMLATPATLYLLTSIAVMYRWPFYDQLPGGCWFLVFNGHHSIAYLGLVFLMRWNELHPTVPLTFSKAVVVYARFLVPLILTSFAALLMTMAYSKLTDGAFVADIWALTGVFVVHYYLESRVWRFSIKHNRDTTLYLLGQPHPR